MTGTPLTTYPAPPKTLSNNYTVANTRFALATQDTDPLEPEDLEYLGKAVEEHTHDGARGLPVRRLDTVSTPASAGQVTVSGDDMTWWGAASALVVSAVNTGTDQVVGGIKRFVQPLLLPRQATAPVAPGSGLGYLYLGPNDRLYLRSGTNAAAPVGTPGMSVPPLAWQTTQATGQPLQQQISLGSAPVWTLGFRATGSDTGSLMTVAPPNYGGTPITCYVEWTGPAATGNVVFNLLCRVTPQGGDLTQPWAQVATATMASPNTPWTNNLLTLSWATALPLAGNALLFALMRDNAAETTAGGSYGQTVSAHNVTFLFG